MSDLLLFSIVFGGLFVLRIIAATLVFLWILPRTDRCLNCDAETSEVRSRFFLRFMPWFRKSWCLACGWEGLLRRPPESKLRSPSESPRDVPSPTAPRQRTP